MNHLQIHTFSFQEKGNRILIHNSFFKRFGTALLSSEQGRRHDVTYLAAAESGHKSAGFFASLGDTEWGKSPREVLKMYSALQFCIAK